jgi:hypothetical protein
MNSPAASGEGWAWCNSILWLIRLRGPEQFTRQSGRDLIWVISYYIVSSTKSDLLWHSVTNNLGTEAFQMPDA